MNEELERSLQTTLRNNMIKYFQLMSSREAQLSYQREVPIAQVSAELICQWEDIVPFDDPSGHFVPPAFSMEELDAIREFHEVWNDVRKSCRRKVPRIEKFQMTREWMRLHVSARAALAVFDRRGPQPAEQAAS
ncbi:MAG: hypothetical protein J5J06_05110 [Phycisphaerae bacterium]|nr:hypothetical protein [Phycisphaerae bacterium]